MQLIATMKDLDQTYTFENQKQVLGMEEIVPE